MSTQICLRFVAHTVLQSDLGFPRWPLHSFAMWSNHSIFVSWELYFAMKPSRDPGFVSSVQACKSVVLFPTTSARKVLADAVCHPRFFYRVRCHAAQSLATVCRTLMFFPNSFTLKYCSWLCKNWCLFHFLLCWALVFVLCALYVVGTDVGLASWLLWDWLKGSISPSFPKINGSSFYFEVHFCCTSLVGKPPTAYTQICWRH